MKFISEFALEKEDLPIDYRRCILSYLKHCLTQANGGKYYDDYYTPGKDKPFCFSVMFDSPKFSKDVIHISGKKMKLMVSSSDTKTAFILFSTMAAQKGKRFNLPKENRMQLISIRQVNEQEVHSSRILVKMLEPLCIRNHNKETNKDWYYSCKDQESFERESTRVIKTQLMLAGYSEEQSNVKLIPVDPKMVIIKHYSINIECTIGTFIMEGKPEVLNYLLKNGIGSRKSSGFGVAQLMAEE